MKNTAHNITEVKALTKEMILRGDIETFNGMTWYKLTGEFICRTFTGLNMFHLEMPNSTTETVRMGDTK